VTTIREIASRDPVLRDATARLAAAGVPNAGHDARALLRFAAETGGDLPALVEARAARVPLQHLTGTTGFRYLELAVGPGVFVPRPESELLVDAVLGALAAAESARPDGGVAEPPIVVDLCAGSGAIGLSVAHEHPRAVVHLVERSASAFEWLIRNAAGRERVVIHHGDLAHWPAGHRDTVDVVVCNPPYVPLDERDLVEPEVRDHDPAEALWAGDDGLAVIRRVVDSAAELLRPGGALVLEHSDRHGTSVPAIVAGAGFVDVVDHLDLTGRPRFCTACRPVDAR
jgi:release factor glutamine methyltransferase